MTIQIKDLTQELNLAEMAHVRGGNTLGQPIGGPNLSVFGTDDKGSGSHGKQNPAPVVYFTYKLEAAYIS